MKPKNESRKKPATKSSLPLLTLLLVLVGCKQNVPHPSARYSLIQNSTTMIVFDSNTADTWMFDFKERRWLRLPNPATGTQLVISPAGPVEFPPGMSTSEITEALESDERTKP